MPDVTATEGSPPTAESPTTTHESSPHAAEFEGVVAQHSPMVLGVCGRMLGGSEVEDAAQAVFILLWQKFDRVTASSNVAGWLHRTAHHVCRNALRSRSIRSKHERQAAAEMVNMSRVLSEKQEWEEIREILDQEIDRLPEKWRIPFVLFHLESRSLADVASAVGASVPTVGTWLQRSREHLADRLRRRGIVIGAAALTTVLAEQAMASTVPDAFVANAIQAALNYTASGAMTTGTETCSATTLSLVKTGLLASSAKKAWLTLALVFSIAVGLPLTTHWLLPMMQTRFSADFPKLQGRWESTATAQFEDGTSIQYTNYLVVSGRRFTKGQEVSDGRRIQGESGTFVLDDRRHPKRVDFSLWFRTAPGLYELDGDTLTLCVATDGARPDAMPLVSGDNRNVTRYTLAK